MEESFKTSSINIGELRSFLKSEKLGKIKGKATRVVIGGDSQVALGCLLKGRSASHQLNRELQASLPHVLGGGTYSFFIYIPTSINPADGPSRCQEIPSPLDPLPDWWPGAMSGDFRDLDRWLESVNADPWTLSGIPDLEEVRKSGPRELKLQKQIKKKAHNAKLRSLFKQPAAETLAALDRDPRRATLPAGFGDCGRRLRGSIIVPEEVEASAVMAKPGYIDLFSGNHGVANELARLTGRWVLTYDIKDSPEQDLLDCDVQEEVKSLVANGSVIGLGAAPVCSSLSRAITPPWRSPSHPHGIPGLLPHQQAKVDQGNQFAKFVGEIAQLCLDQNIPFWIENPWASFIWNLPELLKLQKVPDVGFWLFDFCRFSTPWRKRTRVLTNTWLRNQRTLCTGRKKHVLLRGRCKERKQLFTKLAEPYPKALSTVLAMGLAGASGDRPELRKLDADSCAKCTHCRIGEAKNPGPKKTTTHDGSESRCSRWAKDWGCRTRWL